MVLTRLIGLFFLFWSYTTIAQPANVQMSVWVNEAIIATYTFDYQNFLTQQKEIAKYFTSEGWINYSNAFNNSKLPEAVQQNKYFVSAVALMPPVVKEVGKNHWQGIMPTLVVYKNPQYEQKQTLEVTINFAIAPGGQGVRGLAITSLQSKTVSPPCQCPAGESEPATPATIPDTKKAS